jgi:DNA-binding GntR family transcriptional regulator
VTQTRYSQVAQDLVKGIATGRFKIGSVLPTELELSEQYGASRNTVRAALKELQDLGLVSRRKRAGTRVESASTTTGYRQSLASVEDLIQFGTAHRRVVRKIEGVVANRALARELGCTPGRGWLRISSLRIASEDDALPIGWTDVYIDEAYSGLRTAIKAQPETLISSLIEQRYGRRAAEIRQDVVATTVPENLCGELKAEVGTPALKVVRRYIDSANETYETSVTIHPADRFTFSLRLRRQRGDAVA